MIRAIHRALYSVEEQAPLWFARFSGLSTDDKPTDGLITGSRYREVDTGLCFAYDETTQTWHPVDAAGAGEAITPLSEVDLQFGNELDVVGIPPYVSDPDDYAAYGITQTGWYVFARIAAPEDVTVTAETTVTGAAGYIAEDGADHVDVAVRFDVAAMASKVTIDWGDAPATVYVFRATDLAVRNLDYRTTFYVYDAGAFVTWEYALTTDSTFQDGKTYYTKSGDEYTAATVTTGDPVQAVYYEHSYVLTADETFQSGKTYYTESEGAYTQAEVTAGEAVTANTYYEDKYALTTDSTFQDGKTYYTESSGTYTAAAVTTGDMVPTVYYVHSKCIISGMARNVTYKLDDVIDCPMEFILPEIEDETHGCWYEIRCIHAGEYSMTLTPPSADVKIATEHTQKETKGINMIDLHYTYINGIKLWRFMNTHSSIPEATT